MAHSELYIGDLNTPDYYFSDFDLTHANGELSVDIVGNRLAQDEFEIDIAWDKTSAQMQIFAPADFDAILSEDNLYFATNYMISRDLAGLPYGTPVWYYYDSTLVGKFYSKQVTQTGPASYEMTLMSAVGLLSNLIDRGGMFKAASGDTFLTVLAQIIGGSAGALDQGMYPITGGVFDCLVEQQAAIQPIEGHLKYGPARDNLHELLFAESIALTKSSDGTPLFSFLYSQENPAELDDGQIYLNGRVSYENTATAVEVTEHTFLDLGASDELVTLFDGAAEGTVTDALVLFDDPCHDLVATNLTVSESGANYAIVSGSGTLTGRKYTHSQKTVRREVNDPRGEKNEVSVRDVGLISPLNSSNVADRLIDYYSKQTTYDLDIVRKNGEPRPGRQYRFRDPYGVSTTGFVTKMEMYPSNIMRARCHIVANYKPSGGGNNFSNAILFDSGNIVVPDGVTKMRLTLVAGGSGGNPGANGSAGGSPTLTDFYQTYYRGYDLSTALGGAGGAGGTGGTAGKVLTVDLDPVTPGSTITVTYGTGGASGSAGTDTTVTYNGITYTTANGELMPSGVVNLFTGEVLAKPGARGLDGGNGGDNLTDGGTVSDGGVSYIGGKYSNESAYDSPYYRVYGVAASTIANRCGAGGGGAAFGHNGYDARPYDNTDYNANGGNGANASAPSQAVHGSGGAGGNGGGGGGSAGISQFRLSNSYNTGTGGSGGTGSAGGKGGDGCVLAYY